VYIPLLCYLHTEIGLYCKSRYFSQPVLTISLSKLILFRNQSFNRAANKLDLDNNSKCNESTMNEITGLQVLASAACVLACVTMIPNII